LSVTKSIDFLGTVRGRLGYLVKPRLLVFGTGGFAFGHVNSSTNISQHLVGPFGGVQKDFGADYSVSKMLGGWIVGGGFEWMFAPNWTAKIEYLYYDLGVTSSGQIADPFTIPSPPTTYYFVNDVQTTTRFNGNIVRVGLNYRFLKFLTSRQRYSAPRTIASRYPVRSSVT
jgi:outer membrane immunogenic protein